MLAAKFKELLTLADAAVKAGKKPDRTNEAGFLGDAKLFAPELLETPEGKEMFDRAVSGVTPRVSTLSPL